MAEAAKPAASGDNPVTGQSFAAVARRQFLRNRLAVAGLAIVLLLATIAVWCPLLATEKPYYIKTVFAEEYENAYYSALDLAERIARQAGQPAAARQAAWSYAEAGRLLLERLEEMKASLAGEPRAALKALQANARRLLQSSPSGEGASPPGTAETAADWMALAQRLEQTVHPDRVSLKPKAVIPAIKALRGTEIFFLALWITGLGIWVSGAWRRGFRFGLLVLFLAAAVAGVAWRIAFPPVIDTTDYRALIESPQAAVQYLRAPVPFGENENLTAEANQPPTGFVAKGNRAPGQHFHLLGTDPSGRDVLARMIYGTRISMLIGIVAVSIYVSIGIVVGAIAGYFRGWVDLAVSRVIEVVICFPALFMLLILLAYIRPNIYTIMAALGLISWTGVARLERGEFLRLANQDFVQAVRALGGGHIRIIFRHILPNALGPVMVSASFGIAVSILAESTLSFLGFGVPPDKASWGGLLKIGNDNIQELWWMVVFPGIALFTTVTCFNLVGEGVRDATDPRLIQ